ncbi:MAG: hypothetical protein A2315_16805 [Ignavibacteria bacterium RIFOXYB2_FULL_35_12]|nr:MAG: hypothetical protein A2058_14765 [Ignavibacteria bacterium GWA2_36_19]OGU55633.1 MAG: hypothetical protein A2006_12795 [Ignavibacteria bacterium GWC2_35_8]OGU58563.1 MAG: hypothetical protein A2X60_11765 [Ignavibacteria bacterium GWF2_35_20]OGU82915.1 MAG: hypothetical protein A2254_15010 [Ignavibacteria bacterium RIFOXYA2_FULL_35_9]OGU90109.1 MAG: hypothetical protein A3K31_05755 [Ignavibacteria bacterium RIFOXYA12_FULL_35_25]OGU92098.1 MAG: hypothetical protein A2492_01385 [Ignavibac
MNDKRKDTYEKVRQTRRDQLIDQCLQIGMPVVGDEDEETLEMYIDMAHDDDFDDLELNDKGLDDDRKTNVDSDAKKTSVLEKLVSLFM